MNKRLLVALLLEEDEEEEECLKLLKKKRQKTQDIFKKRFREGYQSILIRNHLNEDEHKFRAFFRLNVGQFQFVLSLVKEDLHKMSTRFGTAEEKLAITLSFMATGESLRSLSFAFKISHSYISIIIKDTLKALRDRFHPIFLTPPSKEELKQKALDFWEKWNFPNCISAVDGQHIRILCPRKSGSLFFNYKDYFSIVLIACVDANYKFVFVNVGAYGKEGDSSIFSQSEIGKHRCSGTLFPPDECLPGSNKILPYVIIGDEAFRLHKHVLKPYSRPSTRIDKNKAIFNYRLSRARRVTENAFGISCQVFRIFFSSISLNTDTCDDLITVACCLHNMLRDAYLEKNKTAYYNFDSAQVPSTNITSFTGHGGFADGNGFEVRNQFMDFFNNEGKVSWQKVHITRTSST